MEQKLKFSSERLGSKKAEIYGKELIKINNTIGLNPTNVVLKAKDKKNPLHNYFDWNVRRAAEKHWLYQARQLINEVSWEVQTYDYKTKKVVWEVQRGFESIKNSNGGREYKPIYEIISNENYLNQIINDALREVSYWEEKYYRIKQLKLIFNAIEKTKKRYKK